MDDDVALTGRRLDPRPRALKRYVPALGMTLKRPMYTLNDDLPCAALGIDRHGFADRYIAGTGKRFHFSGLADRDRAAELLGEPVRELLADLVRAEPRIDDREPEDRDETEPEERAERDPPAPPESTGRPSGDSERRARARVAVHARRAPRR